MTMAKAAKTAEAAATNAATEAATGAPTSPHPTSAAAPQATTVAYMRVSFVLKPNHTACGVWRHRAETLTPSINKLAAASTSANTV